MRKVTLLGATGSIGDSTLDVIACHPDRFAKDALAADAHARQTACAMLGLPAATNSRGAFAL